MATLPSTLIEACKDAQRGPEPERVDKVNNNVLPALKDLQAELEELHAREGSSDPHLANHIAALDRAGSDLKEAQEACCAKLLAGMDCEKV